MENKQPVSYLQKDTRWKDKPYRVKGEKSTVGSAGCGPSCAAMCIETLTGKTFTPLDACNWSLNHGYKALNQGTYYSYFTPQMKAFGIDCQMLNWENSYGKPNHVNHKKVKELVNQGYYAIALMNKGLWTSGGHFILIWDWDDKVRIHDPNSTAANRRNGDLETFKRQAKYYWLVDARAYNQKKKEKEEKEEDDMTQEKFNEMFTAAMNNYRNNLRDNDTGSWSQEARAWAVEAGIFSGSGTLPDGTPNYMWEDLMTREQAAAILYRFAKAHGVT